jgi:hypothetical protein
MKIYNVLPLNCELNYLIRWRICELAWLSRRLPVTTTIIDIQYFLWITDNSNNNITPLPLLVPCSLVPLGITPLAFSPCLLLGFAPRWLLSHALTPHFSQHIFQHPTIRDLPYLGLPPKELGHPWDLHPWGCPHFFPAQACSRLGLATWGFTTQAFPQHACSLELSPHPWGLWNLANQACSHALDTTRYNKFNIQTKTWAKAYNINSI